MFRHGDDRYCGVCYDVMVRPWKEPMDTVQIADIANLFKVGSKLRVGVNTSATETVGTFLDRDFSGIMIMRSDGLPIFYAWGIVEWVMPL